MTIDDFPFDKLPIEVPQAIRDKESSSFLILTLQNPNDPGKSFVVLGITKPLIRTIGGMEIVAHIVSIQHARGIAIDILNACQMADGVYNLGTTIEGEGDIPE